MALDLQDLYMINAMTDRNNIRTRAKTIEDNFGLKTTSVEEYRSHHGGFGWLKGLAIGFGVGIAAALIVTATPFAAAAASIGMALGSLATLFTVAHQNEKVMKGYSGYLDEVSTAGRQMQQRGRSPQVEYDNGAGRQTTFTADLEKARQQPVIIQGATR